MESTHRYEFWACGLLLLIILVQAPPVKQALSTWPLLAPAIWCLVILAMALLAPRIHSQTRRGVRGQILGYAASGAIVFLALRIGTAVILKDLSASPYDHSPLGVASNLFQLLPVIAAREMIRGYSLGMARRRWKSIVLPAVLVTLALTLTEINFGKLGVLRSAEDWFIYIAKDAGPILAKNILLSVLSFHGGAGAGILYDGSIGLFQRLFPYLPALPWIADSALGVSFPILFAVFFRGKVHALDGVRGPAEKDGGVGYILALLAAVAFCWFTVGVFPIYPSVVLTGSMEPMIYPGDAILIRKLADEKEIYRLQEGDVIHFKREDITITHRIVSVILDEAGNISFETKGDNNKSADEKIVLPNDIYGVITRVVPKVGIPILALKGMEAVPEGVTDGFYEYG